MHLSGCFVFCATFLIGTSVAVPVATEWNDELVVRNPPSAAKTFAQAAQAARIAAQIKRKVNPRPNEAVFWAGKRPDGNGGMVTVEHDARRIAKQQGKETLEDHLENNNIHIPLQAQNPHSKKIWSIASDAFSNRAKGDVHAHLGPKMRPESIYTNQEKPNLLRNPHVTKLTEHDVHHGTSTVVKGHGSPSHSRSPSRGRSPSRAGSPSRGRSTSRGRSGPSSRSRSKSPSPSRGRSTSSSHSGSSSRGRSTSPSRGRSPARGRSTSRSGSPSPSRSRSSSPSRGRSTSPRRKP